MAAARNRQRNVASKMWLKRSIALFFVFFLVIFGLIMLTGDKSPTPKLGIDLQGGTRVTLVPQGDRPTSDQLQQARRILEGRVNGMGVSGAEVVTDGDTVLEPRPVQPAGPRRR